MAHLHAKVPVLRCKGMDLNRRTCSLQICRRQPRLRSHGVDKVRHRGDTTVWGVGCGQLSRMHLPVFHLIPSGCLVQGDMDVKLFR